MNERYTCTLIVEGKPNRLSLTEQPESDSFRLLLTVPGIESSEKLRFAQSFSRSYIESLTAKTRRPLRYAQFLRLLRQTIQCDDSDDEIDEDPRDHPVYLDILTKEHIVRLCSEAGHSVRIVNTQSDNPSIDKRYVVLSIGSSDQRVCYPLPLIRDHHDAADTPVRRSRSTQNEAHESLHFRSQLDSLTKTVRSLATSLDACHDEMRRDREASRLVEQQLSDEIEILSQALIESQAVNQSLQMQLNECRSKCDHLAQEIVRSSDSPHYVQTGAKRSHSIYDERASTRDDGCLESDRIILQRNETIEAHHVNQDELDVINQSSERKLSPSEEMFHQSRRFDFSSSHHFHETNNNNLTSHNLNHSTPNQFTTPVVNRSFKSVLTPNRQTPKLQDLQAFLQSERNKHIKHPQR